MAPLKKHRRSSLENASKTVPAATDSDVTDVGSTATQKSSQEDENHSAELYREHLAKASELCRKNAKFDFFQLLDANSHSAACMLGIDEAGRGPVLGPMVYACAVAPINRLDQLKALGLADSKQLTEQKREQLLTEMLQNTHWVVSGIHVISPVFITEKMLDRCKTSLNTISHDAAIGLIQAALDAGINVTEVFVDTVGKAEHYQAKLQALFSKLKICVESKADDTYPIVSAASIFAKVTRDRLLNMWPENERGVANAELGSGYPGDPLTKSYLESCLDPVFGFPSIVRASWSTATTLMDKHGVKITWEDDEDPEKTAEAKRLARKREMAKGTCQLSNFFSPSRKSTENKRTTTRQPYFVRTNMVHVDVLI